jgi:putative protease
LTTPAAIPELLCPGGGPAAGYAALAYGADAVYVGVKRFSARAEAENFSLDELSDFAGYAHSLAPRRCVYVTVNTLLKESERAEAARLLSGLALAGVDAVIVQDLGLFRLLRERLPELPIHASTQMAIHNREGAEALAKLGVKRVTLARELTLAEIRDICAVPGLEVEAFLHGALCYSYSGLCLYSSHLTGRSANRGRCAYPCRDYFHAEGREVGHCFSMKDLALADHVGELAAAGVASLKIEGRKKNELYVAAAAWLYRRILDGKISSTERAEAEAQVRTVFSRPVTDLYIGDAENREVIDSVIVGHRGNPAGKIEAVRLRSGGRWVEFVAACGIEKHDGLQLDLPGQPKPYGFPVLELVEAARVGKLLIESSPGERVQVRLPEGAPEIPLGARVYHASSQETKRSFPVTRPRPGTHRVRVPLALKVSTTPEGLTAGATLTLPPHLGGKLAAGSWSAPGKLEPATDVARMAETARAAFAKLGDTRFVLTEFDWDGNCFVPVSELNRFRREIATALEQVLEEAQQRFAESASLLPALPAETGELRWSLKTDQPACLREILASDTPDEVTLDISGLPFAEFENQLAEITAMLGRERVRLALPVICRAGDRADLTDRICALREQGWRKWEVSNLWGWRALGLDPAAPDSGFDLAADWPLYVLNGLAVDAALALGASLCTASPEDDRENLRALLSARGARLQVPVYQDTPLFISENCPHAAPNRCMVCVPNCPRGDVKLVSSRNQALRVLRRGGRYFTISETPFCLARHLTELTAAGLRQARVDFCYRTYAAPEAKKVWDLVRAGQTPVPVHDGNFDRVLL